MKTINFDSNSKITLSIVIPHLNSRKKLIRLISSIPDSPEIEVIIVDDNSIETEQPRSIDLPKRKKISLLTKKNKGNSAGACRNVGLSRAKGKWITFADADDFFLPGSLESALNEAKNAKPTTEIIFFPPTSIFESNNQPSKRHTSYAELCAKHKEEPSKIRYRFFSPCSKFISNELITRENIFFDEVVAANDVMFSTKTGHFAREIEISPKTIYCITQSEGTLRYNRSKEILSSRLNVTIKYNDFLAENEKHVYQRSILFILAKYYSIITLEDLSKMIKRYIKNKWRAPLSL